MSGGDENDCTWALSFILIAVLSHCRSEAVGPAILLESVMAMARVEVVAVMAMVAAVAVDGDSS